MLSLRKILNRRIGVLALLLGLILVFSACSSDDPVAPVKDDPVVNRAPGAPTIDTASGAPADGAVDVPQNITLHWNCTDADGDNLTYTVHFGNSNTPAAVSSDQTATSYGPVSMVVGTTFYWQVVATDPDDATTASPVWSFTTVGPGAETVTVPGTPAGPANGETGATLTYTVTGSTSNLGHTVGYTFDWGDGTNSDNTQLTTHDHTWNSAGSFDVKVRAYCVDHPTIESTWSAETRVTITDPAVETVGPTPTAPTGPATGETMEYIAFSTSAMTCSVGHEIFYVFDWGDGDSADIQSSPSQINHQYTSTGSFDIRVQGKCRVNQSVVSEWSPTTTVTITEAAETIYTPEMASNLASVGEVGVQVWIRCFSTSSILGHALEYRYDMGDGTITDWASERAIYYTWTVGGTYTVKAQARCAEHTDILSEWSSGNDAHEIVIADGPETIPVPVMTLGAAYSTVVDRAIYFEALTTSSHGHVLQFQFDWGDGTTGDWGLSGQAHAYSAPGVYTQTARARCAEHTDIVSGWATPTVVTVSSK